MTGKPQISQEKAFAAFAALAARGERITYAAARAEAGNLGSYDTWQKYLPKWKAENLEDDQPRRLKPTAQFLKGVEELYASAVDQAETNFVNEAIKQLEEELEMTKEALELTKAELAESRKVSEKAMARNDEFDQMKEQLAAMKVELEMMRFERVA